MDPEDEAIVVTTMEYGMEYASIAGRDGVFGIQFHPEKSQDMGLGILRNFGEL